MKDVHDLKLSKSNWKLLSSQTRNFSFNPNVNKFNFSTLDRAMQAGIGDGLCGYLHASGMSAFNVLSY